jgi:hypothetical protein
MPLNPNIALQVKGLEVPNPLAQMAQVTQIQNALQQQRMGDIQMQNALRQQQRAQGLEKIMSGFAPEAKTEEVASALQRGGYFNEAQTLIKSRAELEKERRQAEEARLKGLISQADIFGRVMGVLKKDSTQEDYNFALSRLKNILKPEDVAQLGETFDYNRVRQFVDMTMSQRDRLEAAFKERATAATETKAQAAASQARSAEERVGIARQAESTAQRRLDVEQRRLDSTERRLTNEERRLALAEENARLAQDPEHQRAMAAARAAGQAVARSEQAAIDVLPKVIDTAAAALANIDAMIGSPERKDPVTGKVIPATKPHPGFTTVVGATMLPGARFVPGTAAADFQARFDQIKGSAFLQAYETLKGGGQITNIEGEKGTAALNRMSIAQSEREFIQAAREFQEVVQKGLERAQRRAQELQPPSQRSGAPRGSAPSGSVPSGGAVLRFNERGEPIQ